METMDIRSDNSGLWKIVEAMKPAKNTDRSDKTSPVEVSKISPEVIISLMSSSFFATLEWATYFVMAEFTPQSRKRFIMSEGIKAMEYSPYSAGNSNLVRIIVPMAIIAVDVATPMNSWKLPVAEILPIFKAFSNGFCSFLFLVVGRLCCEIR